MSGQAVVRDEDGEDAATFLRELLASGPLQQIEVEKAGRGHGFSVSQLRRAKRTAGVTSERAGFRDGAWYWQLEAPLRLKVTADEGSKVSKMTHTDAGVIYGENAPLSPLDSTVIPKVTAVSSSVSSSEGPSSSDIGWEEV